MFGPGRRILAKRKKHLGTSSGASVGGGVSSAPGSGGGGSVAPGTVSPKTARAKKNRSAEKKLQRIQDRLQDLEEGPRPNSPEVRNAVIKLNLGESGLGF